MNGGCKNTRFVIVALSTTEHDIVIVERAVRERLDEGVWADE